LHQSLFNEKTSKNCWHEYTFVINISSKLEHYMLIFKYSNVILCERVKLIVLSIDQNFDYVFSINIDMSIKNLCNINGKACLKQFES
jgi:hypothetical protein